MGQIVGPFEVMDATPAELEIVRAIAVRVPTLMATRDGPGRQRVWFRRRLGAPSWAWGYCTGRDMWVNPARSRGNMLYVTAHEYWHGWQSRHGRPIARQLRALVPGPVGTVQNNSYTNRLSEALAHGFAHALGFTEGVPDSYYRARVPRDRLGDFLLLLGKAEGRIPPPAAILLTTPAALAQTWAELEPPPPTTSEQP